MPNSRRKIAHIDTLKLVTDSYEFGGGVELYFLDVKRLNNPNKFGLYEYFLPNEERTILKVKELEQIVCPEGNYLLVKNDGSTIISARIPGEKGPKVTNDRSEVEAYFTITN